MANLASSGGNAVSNSITGSPVSYGGGGAAGGYISVGSPGSGGGTGGGHGLPGGNATPYTGGGGGGGGAVTGLGQAGGAGGSRVVIISVLTVAFNSAGVSGGTISVSGSNTIVKYTANGSYTPM